MRDKVADFDYQLPPSLIAQKPIRPRDSSRLLYVDRRSGNLQHKKFAQILDFLQAGDILILNNSKVFPARLIGKKASGGRVEIFLHQQQSSNKWQCLVRGKVAEGIKIYLSKKLTATLQTKQEDDTWLVIFNLNTLSFFKEINKIGLVPLPPYIKRANQEKADKLRYQTIFADDKKLGSVAAPTAGLHFTNKLLSKIRSKGVRIEFITLHVGLGTFASVKSEFIKDHKMHSEFVQIKKSLFADIVQAKKEGQRVIAVGTTSCRAIEAAANNYLDKNNNLKINTLPILSLWTDIFIIPGYSFRLIDGLITNFHLPKSTLLMLVSALAGESNIRQAYQVAVLHQYRFFSYGDAMLIL